MTQSLNLGGRAEGREGTRIGHTAGALAETAFAECVLKAEHFGVAFGTRVVLADIDLDIRGPGITALMGPGGTGKSTLLHRMARLPASNRMHQWGEIRYLGHPLDQVRVGPALVHQQARDLSVRLVEGLSTSLRMAYPEASPADLRRMAAESLDAHDLGDLQSRLDASVAELPPTVIRMISLLRASLTGAALLLMDEPTHGLANSDAQRVLRLIEQLGHKHACLVTSHNQFHARQIANWAVLVAGGRIQIATTAAEFFANTNRHPVLAQFLRTGSCSVPAPDAKPEELANDAQMPPPLPSAAMAVVAKASEPTPELPLQPALPTSAVVIDMVSHVRRISPPDDPARLSSGTDATTASPAESLLPCRSTIAPREGALEDCRGPQGFHWLIPGRLAGCPMPGVVIPLKHDLALLRKMGITLLINLTERDVPESVLAEYGIRSYCLRIEDRHAPPLLWAKLLLSKMETFMRGGEILAVHCLAGLGRTGTILCAWLIREGLTADEALRRLRRIDPGFVQSQEQEDLLHELEANLLIRAK
ncbi:MAG: dual specificity protein phosphatase family protein [Lysobacteraceae bacterium]